MVKPVPVGAPQPTGEVDRLGRVADMVTDAVALLNQVMEEIKSERGYDDDRAAAGTPDGDTGQPRRRGQGAG